MVVARVDALQHRLVRRHHSLRVDHALGRSRRAGGEQELGDRVGVDLRMRGVDLCAPAGVGDERLERGRGPVLRRIDARDHLDVLGHARGQREREPASVADIDEARSQNVEDGFELAVVLGDQRIGLRDRRVRHAGDHGAKPDQRMLDAVAGEDRDGPLARQARGRRAPARPGGRCRAPARRTRFAKRLPGARPRTAGRARPSPNDRASRSSIADRARAALAISRSSIRSRGARPSHAAGQRSAEFSSMAPPECIAVGRRSVGAGRAAHWQAEHPTRPDHSLVKAVYRCRSTVRRDREMQRISGSQTGLVGMQETSRHNRSRRHPEKRQRRIFERSLGGTLPPRALHRS